MVTYTTSYDDKEYMCPTVDKKVGRGPKMPNRMDDVMLVSTLLQMFYSEKRLPLPPGARRVVRPGPKFTSEMDLFIRDAQKFLVPKDANGIVSPLPWAASEWILNSYVIYKLWQQEAISRGGDVVLKELTAKPYLRDLTKFVVRQQPLVHGGQETASGGGEVTGTTTGWSGTEP
jgi:hypothetical protein